MRRGSALPLGSASLRAAVALRRHGRVPERARLGHVDQPLRPVHRIGPPAVTNRWLTGASTRARDTSFSRTVLSSSPRGQRKAVRPSVLAPDERFSRVNAVPVEDSACSDAWCLIVGRPV